MNQQEKTFSINVFPCKCATSLITKRKRQKSFYKLQNNPNSLKTDPTENTFNKREREKKKIFIITGKKSNQNGEKISNIYRNF